MKKKVLIITYYWPPSGGAGVQRWLKFVKYLREHGWEPIIYTPENPESPANDESLQKDVPEGITVLKTPIWEPYDTYKRLTGKSKDSKINNGIPKEKGSLISKLMVWVRGNMFIPDPRKFWIKPSIKYLTKYLKENPVDAIISTGPPHSMHLIALGVKKKLNTPWLADFRDPWTFIDFYDQLKLSRLSDKKHKQLEKSVIDNADELVIVTSNWAKTYKEMYGRKFNLITNGYDPADFTNVPEKLDDKFTISHIGSMNSDRNAPVFWKALKELCDENKNFADDLHVKLIGKCDAIVFEDAKKYGIDRYVEHIPYIPHSEVIKITQSTILLLLLLNNTPNVNGIVPGKLFEYMGAKRPILCIGELNGDSAKYIRETKAGEVVGFEDLNSTKNYIFKIYQNFKSGNTDFGAENIERFSRKMLTKDIADLLNKIS